MLVDLIKEIVSIDSPSGYTDNIINHIKRKLTQKEYICEITKKGALLISANKNMKYVLSSHIDTLGGMVRSIGGDGTLKITQIGGYPNNSFEGEYVNVLTKDNKKISGTFLLHNPSAHVNSEVSKSERKSDNMCIRLDAEVSNQQQVKTLGIEVGNYVFFNPRFEYTETGFVKTRFLDDKACAGIFLDILLNNYDLIKKSPIGFFFSNYEEVGHGAAYGIPESTEELIVADMGVVGDGVEGDEYSVSICAKDSSGPYDYNVRMNLTDIAIKNSICYKTDVFPYYGSDGSAALRAGCGFKVGLIGPGVSASHGVERTHIKGLNATKELIIGYIKSKCQ